MPHQIVFLEQALRLWEDTCFVNSMDPSFTAYDQIPEKNWSRLRPYLLNVHESTDFNAKFRDPTTLIDRWLAIKNPHDGDHPASVAFFKQFPLALWSWMRHSRRCFHLSADLEALFSLTSFDRNVRGEDLRFPFESFVITVDQQPTITPQARNETLAGILMYPLPKEMSGSNMDCLGIFAFPAELEHYTPLSREQREDIARGWRRGGAAKLKAGTMLLAHNEKTRGMSPDFSLVAPDALSSCLEEDEKRSKVGSGFDSLRIYRMLMGTVLYLQTLPTSSAYRSQWRPLTRQELPNPHPITGDTQLCVLTSSHALTHESRKEIAAEREWQVTGRQVSTHFRMGYWRRWPGHGHDPEAPRIVWVHPTIVRRDRLQGGELPAGTLTKLR